MRLLRLAAVSFLGALAWGQSVALTLERAVEQALLEHRTRDVLQQRVVANVQLGLQAGTKPNPRLYIQSENTRFWSQPPFSYGNATDNFAYLTQSFETGGKRARRVELAGQNTERARLEAELFDRQLRLRVRLAYWGAAGAARSVDFVRAQTESFRAFVENNRLRVKEGVLAEGDLLRSEVELQRLAAIQRQAEAEAQRLQLALFREMGTEQFPEVRLTSALDSAEDIRIGEAGERTETLIARQTIKTAESNVRLQEANAVPTADLLYGYKRTGGLNTLVWGVQIDLPFRNRNKGAIGAAAADVRSSESQSRVLAAQIEAERQTAQADYLARRQLAQQLIPSIRNGALETLRLAREAYTLGGIDLLRLIDAERVYLESEAQYSRALAELRQAGVALEYAMGVDH